MSDLSTLPDPSPTPEVWMFPYLALDKRQRVGPWRLIPRRLSKSSDFLAAWVARYARGLAKMHGALDTDRLLKRRLGCFVSKVKGRVGGAHDLEQMRLLRLAVVAGILDGNPMSKDEQNAALSLSTSDNASLPGYGLTPDGFVTMSYGAMLRTSIHGNRIGTRGKAFRPPPELHLPLFGTTLAHEYATAVYNALIKGDDLSVRLNRAIEWLDLTWKNSTSIPTDVRVVAIRSGLEVLIPRRRKDKVFVLARSLSTILGDTEAPKSIRSWRKTYDDPLAKEPYSDLEWWFVEFTELRNDIAHGDQVASDTFQFAGDNHVMLGERALRRAIKATLLPADSPLRRTPFERTFDKAFARAVKTVRAGSRTRQREGTASDEGKA